MKLLGKGRGRVGANWRVDGRGARWRNVGEGMTFFNGVPRSTFDQPYISFTPWAQIDLPAAEPWANISWRASHPDHTRTGSEWNKETQAISRVFLTHASPRAHGWLQRTLSQSVAKGRETARSPLSAAGQTKCKRRSGSESLTFPKFHLIKLHQRKKSKETAKFRKSPRSRRREKQQVRGWHCRWNFREFLHRSLSPRASTDQCLGRSKYPLYNHRRR